MSVAVGLTPKTLARHHIASKRSPLEKVVCIDLGEPSLQPTDNSQATTIHLERDRIGIAVV